MRFFIDEDLSPSLAGECHQSGYDATSTRDRAMLGVPDRVIAELCMDEERILVTNNANDFISLAKDKGLHPGLVVMPLGSRAEECIWIDNAIRHIESLSRDLSVDPAELMINRVVDLDAGGRVSDFEFP